MPARGSGCLACAGRCWHHCKHPTQWPSQWLKVGLGLSQILGVSWFPLAVSVLFRAVKAKRDDVWGRLAECLAHNKYNKCQLHLVRGAGLGALFIITIDSRTPIHTVYGTAEIMKVLICASTGLCSHRAHSCLHPLAFPLLPRSPACP